jgi:hypothetical protein
MCSKAHYRPGFVEQSRADGVLRSLAKGGPYGQSDRRGTQMAASLSLVLARARRRPVDAASGGRAAARR